MRIIGKIVTPTTDKCDKCKKFFKRGQEISITLEGKDVLGWVGQNVKHHPDCQED